MEINQQTGQSRQMVGKESCLASCQQSGTTATTNVGAASTGSSTRRNPPKTQGSASEAPSPIPLGSAAPGPTR